MLTIDAGVWIAVYDPRDSFHHASAMFLTTVAERRFALYGPAFVMVEVGCAVARRLLDVQEGSKAVEQLNTYPLLTLLPINERLISTAVDLGIRYRVRGADALYVAAAALANAPLVTWDAELIRRAGAITPSDWLAKSIA